jgi:hypothetical protein
MNPTPRLRFVERDSYSHNGEHFATPHKIRVLQQWFEYDTQFPRGEWRDVPLEKE